MARDVGRVAAAGVVEAGIAGRGPRPEQPGPAGGVASGRPAIGRQPGFGRGPERIGGRHREGNEGVGRPGHGAGGDIALDDRRPLGADARPGASPWPDRSLRPPRIVRPCRSRAAVRRRGRAGRSRGTPPGRTGPRTRTGSRATGRTADTPRPRRRARPSPPATPVPGARPPPARPDAAARRTGPTTGGASGSPSRCRDRGRGPPRRSTSHRRHGGRASSRSRRRSPRRGRADHAPSGRGPRSSGTGPSCPARRRGHRPRRSSRRPAPAPTGRAPPVAARRRSPPRSKVVADLRRLDDPLVAIADRTPPRRVRRVRGVGQPPGEQRRDVVAAAIMLEDRRVGRLVEPRRPADGHPGEALDRRDAIRLGVTGQACRRRRATGAGSPGRSRR